MFGNLSKKYLIYMIFSNITNKNYVGRTSNLTSRLADHASTYKKVVYVYVSRSV